MIYVIFIYFKIILEIFLIILISHIETNSDFYSQLTNLDDTSCPTPYQNKKI